MFIRIIFAASISMTVNFIASDISYADCLERDPIDVVSSISSRGVVAFQLLHGLKISEIEEIEKSLENDLTILIWEYLGLYENGCLSKSQLETINQVTILLSIMHEKYPIESWESDDRVLSFFKEMREMNPEFLEKSYERNWEKIF